jgi:hypothetical protein
MPNLSCDDPDVLKDFDLIRWWDVCPFASLFLFADADTILAQVA